MKISTNMETRANTKRKFFVLTGRNYPFSSSFQATTPAMLPFALPPDRSEANEGLQLISSAAFLPPNSETWDRVQKLRFEPVKEGVPSLFPTPARFFPARVLVFPGNSPSWVPMFSHYEEEICLLVDRCWTWLHLKYEVLFAFRQKFAFIDRRKALPVPYARIDDIPGAKPNGAEGVDCIVGKNALDLIGWTTPNSHGWLCSCTLTFVQNSESGTESSTCSQEADDDGEEADEDGPTLVWVNPEDLLLEQDLSGFHSQPEQEASAVETCASHILKPADIEKRYDPVINGLKFKVTAMTKQRDHLRYQLACYEELWGIVQQLLDEAGRGAGKEQWCRDREECSAAKRLKREHEVLQRIVRVLNMKK